MEAEATSRTVPLKSKLPVPAVREAALAGGHPAPGNMSIRIHVYVSMLHEEEFNRISRESMDPQSAFFGHQFSQEELQRYARPASDFERVQKWLTSYGIKILSTDTSPLVRTIRTEGTVAQFEAAFHVQIYQSQDQKWFANTSEPRIPVSLQGIIADIVGLDNLSGYTAGPKIRVD